MRREIPKHLGFIKLIEAMQVGGCPVCVRITEDVRRSMRGFLYENVNNAGLRDEIRRYNGFCHRHAWQLASFGDALGGAILFGDILNAVVRKLDSWTTGWRRRVALADIGTRPCIFCRLEQQFREAVVSELAIRCDDPEVVAFWNGRSTLCVAHLSQVAARVRDAASRTKLMRMHLRKYQELVGQMRQLVEKSSHDRRGEPLGEAKDSWLRAIEALVGRAGLR